MSTTIRFGWMDALRGASILLVVFGHAVQLAAMYTGHDFTRMSMFVGVIGPLRMPLLFFLSGMLLPRSLAKGGARYFRGKVDNVLYPYLLWSLIIIGASAFFVAVGTWWQIPPFWNIIVSPIEHLWFLAYLLVYYVVAYLARNVSALWIVVAATFLMSIPLAGEWGRLAEMAVPFFLGIAVTRYQSEFDGVTNRPWLCGTLFVSAVALSFGSRAGVLTIPSLSWSLPILLAFFLGSIGLMKPIGETRFLAPIRYIGQNSLIVYLVHWPVMLFLVPVLVIGGLTDPWPLFWVALASGLILSLLATGLANRFEIVNLLFALVPSKRSSPIAERAVTVP